MNKHTLSQTLKSIAHYQEQNNQLKEAIKVNESTIEDLNQSLKEYFPYNIDDVILFEGAVYKIGTLDSCSKHGDDVEFKINLQVPYGEEWRSISRKYITLKQLDKSKLIESKK